MTAGAKPYAAHAGFSAPETTEAERAMLFLAEHHAIRFIANGILARISMEGDIAAECSGDYAIRKGMGL